jgi:hypothetical protein
MTEDTADRARKQREEPEPWHLPHITLAQAACSGDCEQGRRCDCASGSAKFSTVEVTHGGAVSRWTSQDADVEAHMLRLFAGILTLCLLAWMLA